MSAPNLAFPPIADVYFSVRRLHTIPDDEVVGKSVLHSADAPVVMFHAPDTIVAVGAVVNDNVFPTVAPDARPVNFAQGRSGDDGWHALGYFFGRADRDLEFLAL